MTLWRRLFNRARLDREIDVELRDHVERQVADYRRQGLTEAEARRRALAGFGGVDQAAESCRDVWHGRAGRTNSCRTCVTASACCGRARRLRGSPCCRWRSASAPSPRSTRSSMRSCSRRCPFARQRSSCCSHSAWARATASRSRPHEFRRLGANDALAGLCAFRPWPGFRLTTAAGAELAMGQLVSGNCFDVLGMSPRPRPAAAGRRRPRAWRAAGRGDQPRLLAAPLQRRRWDCRPLVRPDGAAVYGRRRHAARVLRARTRPRHRHHGAAFGTAAAAPGHAAADVAPTHAGFD